MKRIEKRFDAILSDILYALRRRSGPLAMHAETSWLGNSGGLFLGFRGR